MPKANVDRETPVIVGSEATWPPLMLRALAGQELPFDELREVELALVTTQELANDALGQLAAYDFADPDVAALVEQLAHANTIRDWYVKRLQTNSRLFDKQAEEFERQLEQLNNRAA